MSTFFIDDFIMCLQEKEEWIHLNRDSFIWLHVWGLQQVKRPGQSEGDGGVLKVRHIVRADAAPGKGGGIAQTERKKQTKCRSNRPKRGKTEEKATSIRANMQP